MSDQNSIRLQKVIADCGVTSRRKAEQLIVAGRVEVNGEIVRTLGTKVNPQEDIIKVDDNVIDLDQVQKEYIVLHKPRGYVTTVSDPEGRKTVMDLVYGYSGRVYPVGRLDYLSEGLLIMTNDGEFANHVMHPKFEVTKVYEVKIFGRVTSAILKKLKQGVVCEDGLLKPLSVRVIEELPNKTWVEFMLGEGKNREIRRLCEAVGLTIDKLKRVAIENLTVNGVAPGKFVKISKTDMYKLLNLNSNGTKISGSKMQYFSPKKTKKIGKHKGEYTRADDKNFQIYRKDQYFQTIKDQKMAKAKLENNTQLK